MFRRIAVATALAFFGVSTLSADFSYHEKSTITGGLMASLLKVAGVFSKQAREPIESTVYVKGDRMAHHSATHISIIDLSAETITTVDMNKKSYTVMTFEQMKQMLDQMNQKMQKKGADQPDVKVKLSVDNTGNTRDIAGMSAKELVVKMEMESTDPETGKSGAMQIITHMWMAPVASGYEEYRNFQKRMGEKLAWSPGNNMFASRPDVSKGMAELYKEAGKIEGMPVFETVVMGAAGQTLTDSGSAPPQQTQQAQQPKPSIGSALGGALGGKFGIGRKKQSSEDPPPQQAGGANGNPGSLLEMQVEMNNFSSAGVDDSQFAIPAGFKKVDYKAPNSK